MLESTTVVVTVSTSFFSSLSPESDVLGIGVLLDIGLLIDSLVGLTPSLTFTALRMEEPLEPFS